MENLEENEQDRVLSHVEETIFVAVGKNVEKNKTTLFWAVQNFAGKKICLLHVHKPAPVVSFKGRKCAVNGLKQNADKIGVLDQYLFLLRKTGVQGDAIFLEKDNIEGGIVEVITQQNVRWLVMGAAADKYYTKKLLELKSKKAIFVCQAAPISCHIWFCCKGRLIYTRSGSDDRSSDLEISSPFLLLNSDVETKQSGHMKLESLLDILDYADGEDDADDELEEASCCSVQSSWSSNSLFGTSKSTPLLTDEEEKSQSRLEQAKLESKNSKKKVYEEVVKRWKEEDNAVESKYKVKALQTLCVKEMSQIKELEELLAKEKQEVQRTQDKHDKTVKELLVVQCQNSALEGQLAESHSVVKELEEKIISAVELLISFKQKRDELQAECGNAKRRVRNLKKSVRDSVSSFQPGLPEFSFLEVNEATNSFDPSWKIGEGRYGNVYRGLLRHLHVAIKMLPSYGLHSSLKFQNEVEVLSRVRHPNLVTLIGTCPESRSLVYEYLRNGSLEDCLTCKYKKTPLRWQTRMRIATEVCSALIYLHSNEPCIIHGNLKPSKVLLDANFVSKLGDFGISRLIPRCENTSNSKTLRDESNDDTTSVYVDPEYLELGKLTPESDVYSFGIILLRLLTGRPVLRIKKDVTYALEKRNFNSVLDSSADDWPVAEAEQLAHLALRCCEKNPLNRPDLVSEIWSVLEALRASCVSPASGSGPKDHRRVPSHFVCPILQEVMKDPQIAADGFTYEGEAIRGWLKSGHDTSPMTNLKLEHCNLLPNYALHQAIMEWQQQW